MMKNKIKNVKGITLTSLAIAVAVLLILTGVIIYNIKDNLKITGLEKLQNDVENLRDKISSYYQQYGKIPAKIEYNNIDNIDSISDAVDIGKFLVIDLSAIENLTLNYGKDYENIKGLNNPTAEEISQYKDLYIINETSHNIFYVEGITIDNETYYTDYTADEKDVKPVKSHIPNEANQPVLKDGMKAITYNEDGTINQLTDEEAKGKTWYSYKISNDGDLTHGGTDTWNEVTKEWGSSHWANAILDGNYYVWIPRYAYKIDESVTYTSQEGESHKIDVKFLSGTSTQAPEGYIVHPAFNFGGQELKGIWVGKYETSNDGSDNAKIIPNVTSWRSKTVATMFEKSQALGLGKTNIDAHMMKNIEWGAVAYLTQSQYGRNGTEISVNQCSDFITGAGRGIGEETDNQIWNSQYNWSKIDDSQKYNGKIGKLSSTTGNMYGIYDMSGGAYDYVMGFYQDNEGNIHTGNSMTANSGFNGYLNDGTEYKSGINLPNEKYYDLYKSGALGKNGDATIETRKWNNDMAGMVYSYDPVFVRGNPLSLTDECGVFSYGPYNGYSYSGVTFRVCLAVN